MSRGTIKSDQIVVDGQIIDLVDPALCTPLPMASDVLERPDQAAAAATVLDPSGAVMDAVTNLMADRLSDSGLIDALIACDRLKAAVDAKQVELLAQLHRRDPDGLEYLQDEVSCALRIAPGTAADRIETSTELISRLRDSYDLVRAGRLPAGHARHLASACHGLADDVVAKVQQQVLRRACSQTFGEFKAAVRRAIAKHDTKNLNERHQDAATKRHASIEHVEDGMSWLNLYLPRDGAQIVWTAIGARAVKTDPTDDRTADQRRADAVVEIAQAALANPDLISQHGIRPSINITLAATTMAGLDEQPGLMNGEPIPADLARRFARHPDARHYYWLVNTSGQVLDRCAVAPRTGDDQALRTDSYSPTIRIARHVIARDQHCVVPGCRRSAQQCQLDHRVPWAAGDTSVQNLQTLCKRHHDMKHHSRWTVERDTDGSYQWTSPTRHTYRYRPPEYPVPTEPAQQQPPVEDDEPPPF